MTEAGGHHHESCSACGTDDVQGSPSAREASCSGEVEACGAEAGACCGGHGEGVDDMFAFPMTTEVVSVPAVALAGLLDLVEKLAADPTALGAEEDYINGQRLLEEQAPRLVALRGEFLERMKVLLGEALSTHAQEQ